MTQGVALTAPAALGLPAAPVHEPVHARRSKSLPCVVSTVSGNLPWDAKATQNDHSAVQEHCLCLISAQVGAAGCVVPSQPIADRSPAREQLTKSIVAVRVSHSRARYPLRAFTHSGVTSA